MKTQLLTTLGNAKNYTLGVAEAMPEQHYDFKPTAAVWNFGELLHHIGYGIGWWKENYIRQQPADWNPPAAKAGKAAAVSYLKKAFASLEKSMEKVPLSDEVLSGFYATLDHITHHRGQATIYLRMNGIIPPEYVY
ncbi:DinB family protein [Chitinophaga sp. 22321]|uniref:DinB family protein n=1 Tax=Chitinophaga hostae TaxID=2831022 RepID=A0ABS5J864_9BACT|nr:DinB family protein [Chitinophaga hostae]MBS0031415.1 DinB family protein [Chitinophaga hostae]